MPAHRTDADVFRYYPPKGPGQPVEFGSCSVHLGWEETKLLEECGPPDQVIARQGEACLVYRTIARSIAGGHAPATAYVVCLRTRMRQTTPVRRVESVHGVDHLAPGVMETGER